MIGEKAEAARPQESRDPQCQLLQKMVIERFRQVVDHVGNNDEIEITVKRARQVKHISPSKAKVFHAAMKCRCLLHGNLRDVDAQHLVYLSNKPAGKETMART